MPPAPKPVYNRDRARAGRKAQMDQFREHKGMVITTRPQPIPATRPAPRPVAADADESPDYRVQKMLSIEFWAEGEKLSRGAFGKCCVCGVYLTKNRVPSAHHAIVRRSAGVRIDDWMNLLPVCSQNCHDRIENHEVLERVMNTYYLKLSQHQGDNPPTEQQGYQFLVNWIEELHSSGRLDTRQPYTLPPPKEQANE